MILRALILVAALASSVSAQGFLDWIGQPTVSSSAVPESLRSSEIATLLRKQLLALKPPGKYAYIVTYAQGESLANWKERAEIQAKGWGVVTRSIASDDSTCYVVVGERVFQLNHLATFDDLRKVVEMTNSRKVFSIKVFTRLNCEPCERWLREELPKAQAAGALVEVLPELDNSRGTPHFRVCGADGLCREYPRFTTFQEMVQ